MAEPSGGEQINWNPNTPISVPSEALQEKQMTLEAGFLGKFFGSATNAPTNIAGLIALLLTLSCIVLLFFPSHIPALEFLKLVLPVIMGVLGYLFGKSTREKG